MQFDRHPDAIRVSVVAVPRIVEATVLADCKKRVVGESRGHQHIFIHRVLIVFPELLHVTCAQNLGVNFQKLVPGVDGASVSSGVYQRFSLTGIAVAKVKSSSPE